MGIATLAQSSEEGVPSLPLLLFYIGIPAFTLVAVAVVCWIFWRAKQRDDEQQRLDQQSKERELSWRNARSS